MRRGSLPGVRIVTDSSCDLPQDLASQLGIEIVPLTIRFGEEEFVDRRDLSPTEFWARVAASPVLPETAAPAPGAFEEVFRKAGEAGADGIVCVNLSSKLSATLQAAQIAAKAVEGDLPVRVVDSLNVTMALGMLCVGAAHRAAEGATIDEVATQVEERVAGCRVYATLDTLENLKKGGRIGGAQAFLGSMLNIKPIIEVRDGAVEQEAKARTRAKALRYVAEKVKSFGTITDVAVMHGNAPDVEEFVGMIGELFPREEIVVGDIGAVIGTHAGPRTVGVTFRIPA
jgi:DegV family protein with EDD domain